MHAQTGTDKSRFSGVSQSRNHKLIVEDLETIEELFQIRLALVDLTRRIDASDNCRFSAVIEISRAMGAAERAANYIRATE